MKSLGGERWRVGIPLEAPSSRPAIPSRQMLLAGVANLENAFFWGSMGVRVLGKWRRGGRCGGEGNDSVLRPTILFCLLHFTHLPLPLLLRGLHSFFLGNSRG